MSVRVGGSTYQVLLEAGALSVSGPEDQMAASWLRLRRRIGGYQVSLAACLAVQ